METAEESRNIRPAVSYTRDTLSRLQSFHFLLREAHATLELG